MIGSPAIAHKPRPKDSEASLPTVSLRAHWSKPAPCALFGGALPQIHWIKSLVGQAAQDFAMNHLFEKVLIGRPGFLDSPGHLKGLKEYFLCAADSQAEI